MKGTLRPGQYADLAVLSADYMTVLAEEIRSLSSVLTVLGGKIVYAAGDFASFDPPLPPASPSWTPAGAFDNPAMRTAAAAAPATQHARACHDGCAHGCGVHGHDHQIASTTPLPIADSAKKAFWGALGCSCFAV